MLEHNDLTQDEQTYSDLTRQLQESYPIEQEDQQSLQRIRSRIQQASIVNMQPARPQENPRAGQFIQPPAVQRQRHRHSAHWRIGLLVALIVILLSAGTFISFQPSSLSLIGRVLPFQSGTSTVKPRSTPVIATKNHPALTQISMKSATIGWGTTLSGNGGSQHKVIERTTDGGKSWNEVPLPATYTTFTLSFFLDGTTAWISPGTSFDTSGTPLLRTIDGGKSWEKFMIPGETQEITFVDQQHGWAMDIPTPGPNAAMDQERAILHTSDGGKTWEQLSIAQAGNTDTTPGPFPSGDTGQGIFLNQQTGWFVRGSTTPGDEYKALYITQDGGKTWQLQSLPQSGELIPGPDVDSGDVSANISVPRFFDAQHGNLLVYNIDQATTQLYVYSTSDAGQSWQVLGNKVSLVANGSTRNVTTITLIDATHFIFAEEGDVVTYELVAGTWQEQYKTAISGFDGFNVNFINGQTGWLVNNKEGVVDSKKNETTYIMLLYKTSDGGKSWQEVERGSYVVSISNSLGG
jgi:photosystem II stability/assembly factor-like uncharacterized protein